MKLIFIVKPQIDANVDRTLHAEAVLLLIVQRIIQNVYLPDRMKRETPSRHSHEGKDARRRMKQGQDDEDLPSSSKQARSTFDNQNRASDHGLHHCAMILFLPIVNEETRLLPVGQS